LRQAEALDRLRGKDVLPAEAGVPAWCQAGAMNRLHGAESMGATTHFGIFALVLKQQREDSGFAGRNRRQHRRGAD
jgi:hypothetical protein